MKDYKVGEIFKVIDEGIFHVSVEVGALLQLEDLGGQFRVISGEYFGQSQHDGSFSYVKRIWPPEKDTVTVVCEGKKVEISRESARSIKELAELL